jgi:hypothetical protein
MDQNEFPLEPQHLGAPSGASKIISKPMVLWPKSYTYLTPTQTLSPNGQKWVSTWASSPRITIGCIQNDFWAYGTLAQIVQLSSHQHYLQINWNEIPCYPSHLGVPSGAFKMISEPWYIRHKPCTNYASRLALSPNGPKRVSTWALSPRRTLECIQNDF